MLVRTLPTRPDPYIIIQKKNLKKFIGKATEDEVKGLNDEGLETQTIPWIKDKDN